MRAPRRAAALHASSSAATRAGEGAGSCSPGATADSTTGSAKAASSARILVSRTDDEVILAMQRVAASA
ncbi:MAG TPA: hypothetical protein VIW03_09540 [Anaeromyxobacter sp.]